MASFNVSNAPKPKKVNSFRFRNVTTTPTFNTKDGQLQFQRIPSFARFPSDMYVANDIPSLDRVIPIPLLRFCDRNCVRLLSRLGISSGILEFMPTMKLIALTGRATDNWSKLKTAMLSHGHRNAFAHAAIAICLNHIRSILFPWLGAYMWCTPMEDLRLAIGNPDVFLAGALSFSWRWMMFCYVQKYICDIIGQAAMTLLINSVSQPPGTVRDRRNIAQHERLLEMCKIGYIAWLLATIEYIFTRSVYTFSFLIAYYKLIAGGDPEHVALGAVLKTSWTRLPLNWWQLFCYVQSGFWPLLCSSLRYAATGEPGLILFVLSAVGGVISLIKYRSTFFIPMQISGLFVFSGYFIITAVLLGLDFLNNPPGLQTTTIISQDSERAKED
ncbi:hypothetical protein B0H63DRAFT_473095 [Podospora didyma]|uniref:Uncharacterized protein n=1 Tax=Podospora didyma TaxID=330526 RepID=A0AAE0TZQ8_9PEZI|nr:hypothetical protein B0H63DRAFT_473095 [Podospora didyma]